MRNTFFLVAALLLLFMFSTGCAGPERKFGRGLNNVTEFTRGGEIRRSMEQTAIFNSPDVAYSAGFFHGFNRSVARTFVGVYEILTFPIPDKGRGDYRPVFLPENPVYPENYKPHVLADQIFSPDAALGFVGGDVPPFIQGSPFRIFDN